MVERVPTFVEGLDEALDGGIPKGSVVLVCGTPGTMKTSLVFSILYNNVKHNGSKALFVSLEQGYEDLRVAMEELGMRGLEDMDLYILDVSRIRREHKDEEAQKDWMQVLTEYIDKRLGAQDFDLLAIDPLSGLYSLSEMKNPRRDLFHFFSFLKELGPTSFLISEIPYGSSRLVTYEEDFLADGIFLLRHHEMGEGDVQLRIRCVKMRKTRHDTGYFTLIRAEDRFMVTSVIVQ
jgi:KaiC/GvpD/RAD55 family RecA-like ATPase